MSNWENNNRVIFFLFCNIRDIYKIDWKLFEFGFIFRVLLFGVFILFRLLVFF